jgi:Ribosomal protein S11.
MGFRGSKKNTPYAGPVAAQDVLRKLMILVYVK